MYGSGWVECTAPGGEKIWVNLATVLRMTRHPSADRTTLKFIEGSTLDVTDEPTSLLRKAYSG
jgi:hypothetical protein